MLKMRGLLSAVAVLTLVAGSTLTAVAADQTIGAKIDDAAITTKVKAKLTAERVKNLVNVKVETKEGVVHLEGTVPTEADKAAAEQIVRAVNGVRDVQNDLVVASAGTGSSPAASPSTR